SSNLRSLRPLRKGLVVSWSDAWDTTPAASLCERRHRGLARRRIAVRWRAVLMVAKGQRPHPRRTLRRGVHLHDAADDGTIGEHIVVVVVPLTGGPAC